MFAAADQRVVDRSVRPVGIYEKVVRGGRGQTGDDRRRRLLEEALKTMTEHKVRRLPVIDGHDLIGVISQADIATNLPDEEAGSLVGSISAAP
jgi:hypothetical protein